MASSSLDSPNEQYLPDSMKFLSKLSLRYRESWEWYRKWVTENPDVVSQVEKTFRVLSYFITGFLDDSEVLAEFVYSLSNLLVFFNDNILRKAHACLRPKLSLSQERLMKWLTTLDHTEVFFELASQKLWGEPGKWIVVASIQLLRTIFRLILLRRLKSGIQSSPPIPQLDRQSKVLRARQTPGEESNPDFDVSSRLSEGMGDLDALRTHQPAPMTFEGRRSGRVIRTLHAAPEMGLRTWKLPANSQPIREEEMGVTELAGISLAAETLYVTRPLVHLCCLFTWGSESWKPWLVSLAADIASLKMLKKDKTTKFNAKENSELVNRRLMLLFYLLRSPCFDLITRTRLEAFLTATAESIPGTKLIIKPLVDYLPVWQKIYFYNWGK